MRLEASALSGKVVFIAGDGRGSGKTALLAHALGLLRSAGERPAYLGVGLDGESERAAAVAGPFAHGRGSLVPCLPGELFLSSERYLRLSGCESEIVALLPGSGALGRLAIARARRPGLAVLVGPDSNELAALAIGLMRGELGARTVLVDGAINRITQVASFPGSVFFVATCVSPGDLAAKAKAMRRLALLADLPELGARAREDPDGAAVEAGLGTGAAWIEGALTASTLDRVGAEKRTIVVEDFTKVFLDEPALSCLLRDRSLAVERRIGFGGFVARLRDLSWEAFCAALRDERVEALVLRNPYEEGVLA